MKTVKKDNSTAPISVDQKTLISSLVLDEAGWVQNAWDFNPDDDSRLQLPSAGNHAAAACASVLPHTRILTQLLLTSNSSELKIPDNTCNGDDDLPCSFLQNLVRVDGLKKTLQKALEEVMNMQAKDDESCVKSNTQHPPYWKTQLTLNSIQILLPIMDSIISHPEKRNGSLNLMKVGSSKNQRRKKQALLIYKQSYDVCSIGELQMFETEYSFIVQQHFPPDAANMRGDGAWLHCFNNVHKKIIYNPSHPSTETKDFILNNKALLRYGKDFDNRILEHLFQKSPALDEQDNVKQVYSKLSETLKSSRIFRNAKLSIYGSSLTKLSVNGSDVDLSLDMPHAPDKGRNDEFKRATTKSSTKSYAYALKNLLESNRTGGVFLDVQAIHWARIPVVKGRYCYFPDVVVNFDVCFNNHIAVANSQLIYEYTQLHNDSKVRHLIILIKMWIKKHDIGSAANGNLSSYSWINLLIFYLQCIGFVPNLQCKRLIEQHTTSIHTGTAVTEVTYNYSSNHNMVNELDTCFLRASAVKKAGIWKTPTALENVSLFGLMVSDIDLQYYAFFVLARFRSTKTIHSLLLFSTDLNQMHHGFGISYSTAFSIFTLALSRNRQLLFLSDTVDQSC